MQIDIKDRLTQLEAQVAVIKDPSLRQIAFTKLMETVVQPPAAPGIPPAAQRKQNPPPTPPKSNSKSNKNKAAAFFAMASLREDVQKLSLTGMITGLPNFRDCDKG